MATYSKKPPKTSQPAPQDKPGLKNLRKEPPEGIIRKRWPVNPLSGKIPTRRQMRELSRLVGAVNTGTLLAIDSGVDYPTGIVELFELGQSTVIRNMRELRKLEFIDFARYDGESSQGAPRKRYRLTELGRRFLDVMKNQEKRDEFFEKCQRWIEYKLKKGPWSE